MKPLQSHQTKNIQERIAECSAMTLKGSSLWLLKSGSWDVAGEHGVMHWWGLTIATESPNQRGWTSSVWADFQKMNSTGVQLWKFSLSSKGPKLYTQGGHLKSGFEIFSCCLAFHFLTKIIKSCGGKRHFFSSVKKQWYMYLTKWDHVVWTNNYVPWRRNMSCLTDGNFWK